MSPADTASLGFERVILDIVTSTGNSLRVECAVVAPAWVLKATGYDMGYHDGLGLGVYRESCSRSLSCSTSPHRTERCDCRIGRPLRTCTESTT